MNLATLSIIFVGLAWAGSAAVTFEPVATLSGKASVVDGDGLLFGNVEVRLRGIAAPELSDEMGQESKTNLENLAEGKFAECLLDGSTAGRSRRPVGVCYVEGVDIGFLQVAGGFALDCPNFSDGQYSSAQATAISEGKDLSKRYELPLYC